MTNTEMIRDFLQGTDWSDASIGHLAGDASARSYVRLTQGEKTAVVMVAPPELGNDTAPFLNIAQHLRSHGMNAPQDWKTDTDLGLILMQDFGDGLFYNRVNDQPDTEAPMYMAALDVLAQLSKCPLPADATPYGPQEMSNAAGLAPTWYAFGADSEPLKQEMRAALERLDWTKPCLALRDYHAQNLVWYDDQVGLLDFQDAQVGHPLYDAASLLFDARRDVSPAVLDMMLNRLKTESDDPEVFEQSLMTLSAQRNLRILGVFARLCCRDGKISYVDLIPRVWGNLQRELSHPALADLREVCAILPDPTEAHLNKLRDLCGTLAN